MARDRPRFSVDLRLDGTVDKATFDRKAWKYDLDDLDELKRLVRRHPQGGPGAPIEVYGPQGYEGVTKA
jgi:hypothetical protein